jgi:predicted NBD/HSP70 family sugar kinase
LAEASSGVAQNVSHFIYFSINHNRQEGQIRLNSFGSALFLDGRVYRGAHFAAGELDTGLMPRRDLVAEESDMVGLATPNGTLSDTAKELAQSAGATLASLVNFLDAEMIVIGGNSNISNTKFLAAVNKQMEPQLVQVPGRVIRVVVSQVRDEAVALGAAIAACEAAIESGILIGEVLPVMTAV